MSEEFVGNFPIPFRRFFVASARDLRECLLPLRHILVHNAIYALHPSGKLQLAKLRFSECLTIISFYVCLQLRFRDFWFKFGNFSCSSNLDNSASTCVHHSLWQQVQSALTSRSIMRIDLFAMCYSRINLQEKQPSSSQGVIMIKGNAITLY